SRRERLLELAQERSFFVLEDAVYSNLRYAGTEPPRLRAGAPAHVIYVDSLSKTVGGGLRIGWIAARGPILGRLATLKMDTDIHTSALDQHIAARYLSAGHHDRQLERSLPYYRERRDALMTALERHLAGEMALQGGHERVAALAIVGQRPLQLAVVVARREVARGDVLVQGAGVDVGVHLQRGQATQDRAAGGDPADP